jgi:PKHD-type hydroxylase
MYQFLPNRPRNGSTESFITWEDAFTSEEIDRLIALCEANEQKKAQVGSNNDGVVNEKIRRSKVSWLENSADSLWVYDRLAFIARSINSDFYRFDLYGFIEHMQYTVYEDNDQGHYTWHVDAGPNMDAARKLSIVLQLSNPEDYEGGELQVFTASEPVAVVKQKGLVAAFPSYTLHRVTPVTKGIRRTLVIWVGGPEFK